MGHSQSSSDKPPKVAKFWIPPAIANKFDKKGKDLLFRIFGILQDYDPEASKKENAKKTQDLSTSVITLKQV